MTIDLHVLEEPESQRGPESCSRRDGKNQTESVASFPERLGQNPVNSASVTLAGDRWPDGSIAVLYLERGEGGGDWRLIRYDLGRVSYFFEQILRQQQQTSRCPPRQHSEFGKVGREQSSWSEASLSSSLRVLPSLVEEEKLKNPLTAGLTEKHQ